MTTLFSPATVTPRELRILRRAYLRRTAPVARCASHVGRQAIVAVALLEMVDQLPTYLRTTIATLARGTDWTHAADLWDAAERSLPASVILTPALVQA
ncbi:hypothetical protein [Blastococcus mobilis]|uniref:Uncharacterized protein n=1 Tax=Blastococcus mobilis TaxID=1938746 RepID=A0A238VWB0_9ACTN|nr:hypothetical protein [Blastococcus mobilis]SNR38622.1 hypothetical protein SAMN06272737_105105 [Blastococcus mobilis]